MRERCSDWRTARRLAGSASTVTALAINLSEIIPWGASFARQRGGLCLVVRRGRFPRVGDLCTNSTRPRVVSSVHRSIEAGPVAARRLSRGVGICVMTTQITLRQSRGIRPCRELDIATVCVHVNTFSADLYEPIQASSGQGLDRLRGPGQVWAVTLLPQQTGAGWRRPVHRRAARRTPGGVRRIRSGRGAPSCGR
jgi:hypothetical protein